jgi:argininosuccinate lyase
VSGKRPTWAGRLPGGLAPDAWDFLHSLPEDAELFEEDVIGSIAHVRALEAAGVLTAAEARRLGRALRQLDRSAIDPADEDVHSSVERLLTEKLGDLGAKVHAGRSRNDQVATDMRLYVRRRVLDVWEALIALLDVLISRAAENADALAPGYTHLQRAQPVSLGHWLLAHACALSRDAVRLRAAWESCDSSPLGAGALAGSTLGIDPGVSAVALGFSRTFGNSIDAVCDRDFLIDATYACAVALAHVSRLGEEIVIWSSSEFGFVRLPDDHATGSSMMPQKKNPDVAEVARAEAGPSLGALVSLLATVKGVPLAYDRDLQTDKRNLRATFERTELALRAMAGLVAGLAFNLERLASAASDDTLLSTDLAEALVAAGVPFRKAHERVGALARDASYSEASLADAMRAEHVAPLTLDAARGLLDARESLRRRTTPGGPSAPSVRRQVRELTRLMRRELKLVQDLRSELPTRRSAGEPASSERSRRKRP